MPLWGMPISVRPPTALERVARVLELLADGCPHVALSACGMDDPGGDQATALGLRAVASFWLGDYARATADAAAGLAVGQDDQARALCLAAGALAAGGDLEVVDRATWDLAADALSRADAPASPWWSLVRYLVAEAAMIAARIDDADRVLRAGPPPADAWAGHPFAAVMIACQVRVAAFSGRIEAAQALLQAAREAATHGRIAVVIEALAGLVLGSANDSAAVGTRLAVVDAVPVEPRDFVDRGTYLLMAFAANAVDDVGMAAALVLRAGADEELSRCTIIDRALGLELLLTAALAAHDDAAVAAWLSAVDHLRHHPIAEPTLTRALARVALARGEVDDAIGLASSSIQSCRSLGRQVEAAHGEILLAQARIAARDLGGASRGLRAVVLDSDRTGHASVRRAATAVLVSSGRRLPPVAGAGWAALSSREAEVARAILTGMDADEIASHLFLSVATVRVHTSRVLCAFGVASRIGLLAKVGDQGLRPMVPQPPLSPRQAEVAALVAQGLSNQLVAQRLGITVKGVEKHVGDILRRWSGTSRFDLARRWWASSLSTPSSVVVRETAGG